jgi:hypothetical protein
MARTILGASPLGISFFGETDGKNWLKKHDEFTQKEAEKLDGSTTRTTTDTVKVEGEVRKITLDNGLGFRTFGDKKSIFTNKESNPRTFYLYGERQEQTNEKLTYIDYIKSSDEIYYNSNYLDQNSTIPQIISTLDGLQKSISKESGAQPGKGSSIKLKHSDFAYLKKLGVYPANRLVIARRFDTGVGDDLASYVGEPISLIPSWIEDGNNFIDINFAEEWENHENTSFAKSGDSKSIGNFFSEYRFGEKATNDQANSGFGVFAQPGFTEWLQYKLFKGLELTDANNLILLPQGNPNIIRKSKRRTTYSEDRSFSGLKYTFGIDIKAEYEIKYIDGIDPTVIYFDIISNLLSFGTSDAQFQFDGRFNKKMKEILDDLSSGNFVTVMTRLGGFINDIVSAAGEILKTAANLVKGLLTGSSDNTNNFTNALFSSQVKKYRLHFLATINALTGSPSGIYHVTVGNPLRPIFASGDLLPNINSMKLTLGPELGYNNLPTTIKFECKLENARPCGLQEIYRKFSPPPIRKLVTAEDLNPVEDSQEQLIINASQITRTRT